MSARTKLDARMLLRLAGAGATPLKRSIFVAVVAVVATAIVVAPSALAQTPPPNEPTTQAAPNEPPQAKGEGAAEGEHEKGGEELHHEIGPPEPMNVADVERYRRESCIASGKAPAECGVTDEQAKEMQGKAPVIPYVYILINALALYAMYYYLGKKPIGEGLKARRDAIAKELDEAATIKSEAAAKLEEYTERLDKLDQELDRLKAELTLAGEKDRDRIVKDAEEKAARMKKDAQFLLDQEVKQLRIDLQKYAVDAAMRAAETAIKGKLSSQDHDRVADEYVANIGKLPPPGAKGAVSKSGGAS
jgi:F-type H+-transporting ATPase subunit b